MSVDKKYVMPAIGVVVPVMGRWFEKYQPNIASTQWAELQQQMTEYVAKAFEILDKPVTRVPKEYINRLSDEFFANEEEKK